MTQRIFRVQREGPVTTLTFDWPDKANAMGLHFSAECLAHLDRIAADRQTRVLVVTGAGHVFCGGGDLFEIMSPDPTDLEADLELVRGYNRVAERLHYFDVPVIAAVNGPAMGGGAGIAMACDIAIASEHARYDIVFGKVGLSGADVGVPYLLSRLIGSQRAAYHLFSNGSIDAQAGLASGLFAEVVPADRLLARAHELAAGIAGSFSPAAARMTKVSLRHGAHMDFRSNLEYEAYVQAVAFQSPAHKQRIGEYRDRIAKKGKKA